MKTQAEALRELRDEMKAEVREGDPEAGFFLCSHELACAEGWLKQIDAILALPVLPWVSVDDHGPALQEHANKDGVLLHSLGDHVEICEWFDAAGHGWFLPLSALPLPADGEAEG